MKKTVSINLGSVPLVLDEEAFMLLSRYLDDIKSRIDDDAREEVVDDIENRVADILSAELRNLHQVVTTPMVRRAIDTIGSADTFGERKAYHTDARVDGRCETKRLYRSRNDSVVAGICGGLASYFAVDPIVIRLVMFILIFFGGVSLWVYIILWIVLPKEPIEMSQGDGFGGGRL